MKINTRIIIGIVSASLFAITIIYSLINITFVINSPSKNLSNTKSTVNSLKESIQGINELAETIGIIEFRYSYLYIWKNKDNELVFTYLLSDSTHKKFEDVDETGYDISNFDKLFEGWWSLCDLHYPVAMDIRPTDVESEEYEGQKAQYKDFNITINGEQKSFRVFYVDLTSPDASPPAIDNVEDYNYNNDNDIKFSVSDFILFAFETIIFISLIISLNKDRKKYYLHDKCDPYKYYSASLKKDTSINHLHNLEIKIVTQFYTGEFDNCINSSFLYLESPKTRKTKKLSIYALLCYSLFLTGKNEECISAMDNIEKYWVNNKPFPLNKDFSFIRNYIEGKYNDAIECLQEKQKRATKLRNVRVDYFLGLAYMKLGMIDMQKKYMKDILKFDNKTYFAVRAKEIME